MSLPDARKLNHKISSENHKVFQQILKKCSEQIKYTNKLKKNHMIFEIPAFLPDLTDYNMKDCAGYIKRKLESSHYNVTVKYNVFFINWDKSQDVIQKESQISSELDSLYELKKKFPKAKLEYIIKQ